MADAPAPESTQTPPETPAAPVEPEPAPEPVAAALEDADISDTDAGRCPVCGLLTDNRCSHT